MDDSFFGGVAVGVLGLLILGLIFIGGIAVGESSEQDKAIKAGVARWVVDAKTGAKTFEYGAKP